MGVKESSLGGVTTHLIIYLKFLSQERDNESFISLAKLSGSASNPININLI